MPSDTGYADQRYYYAVSLRFSSHTAPESIWTAIDGIEAGRLPDTETTVCRVEHRTMVSERPYGRELPERQARTAEGLFIYDVSAIFNAVGANQYLTLAVPYAELGIEISLKLRNSGVLRRAEFIKPDLQKLLRYVEDQDRSPTSLNISRIEIGLTGFPEVTGFSLAGDQILGTALYRTLKNEITRQDNVGIALKRCVVKLLTINGMHLSIWCDAFGNYRLWLQRNAKNAPVFCNFLHELASIDAELTTATIPFFRAREEG